MQFYTYYFVTSEGKNPVKVFIRAQDKAAQKKILETIADFGKYGFQLPPPELKHLSGQQALWELRIKSSGNIYRIFVGNCVPIQQFYYISSRTNLKKPPKKDIKTALKRLQIIQTYGGV